MISPKQFSLNTVSPGWLRGFLLLMGSEEPLCVFVCPCLCCTQTSLPQCHQLISEVTQAVSAQPEPMMSLSVEWEMQIEKGKQEVIVIYCPAEGKKESVIICNHSLFSCKSEKKRFSNKVWRTCLVADMAESCESLSITKKERVILRWFWEKYYDVMLTVHHANMLKCWGWLGICIWILGFYKQIPTNIRHFLMF